MTFSLVDGGPFYRLVGRLHLRRRSGMVSSWWLALALWMPLAITSVVRFAFGMAPDPTLRDIAVHVRVLVTLPALLVGERLLQRDCAAAIATLDEGEFCDRSALVRIVARGERLRDSPWAEAILFGLALIGGQLALWNISGATGFVHATAVVSTWSFARVWYALVALPVVQFVMFRWLWRWLIWSYMLAAIARLPLRALATHPDHAAGLAPLAWPMTGFGVFTFSVAAVLAGAWATQLIEHTTTLQALIAPLAAFLVAALVLALGPLLMFCRHMFDVRRATFYAYSAFAQDYVQKFNARWVESHVDVEQALGSSDIQSLADIGNAFRVVDETRMFVFTPRAVISLLIAALLPMLPLVASTMTIDVVLKRIVGTVLGGR
jgi:hypothetical protein